MLLNSLLLKGKMLYFFSKMLFIFLFFFFNIITHLTLSKQVELAVKRNFCQPSNSC